MVICCVPACNSESGKKNRLSVSFHDFPLASEALSLQWMNQISRKDWTPTDTSKVCSLHFLPSDYKCGGKLKRLLPNAVPSVFPAYSAPKKMKVSVKKVPIQTQVETDDKMQDQQHIDELNSDGGKEVKEEISEEVKILKNDEIEAVDANLTTSTAEKSENFNVDAATMKENVQKSKATKGKKFINLRKLHPTQFLVVKLKSNQISRQSGDADCDVKQGVEHMRELNAYKAKLRRREEKIRKLESEVSTLKKKLDVSYMDDKFVHDLSRVFQSAKEGDVRALFILQQIKSFSHKAAHWDERILRELVVWRTASLKGYEKAKNSILVLPHRTTLTAYVTCTKEATSPNDKPVPDKNFNVFGKPDDLSDDTLERLAENGFENLTENPFKASFDEPNPFETDFEKMLDENKLEGKLGNILNDVDDTLANISDNTFEKLLDNKMENKLETCFENTLDDSLENIMLENTFQNM